MLIDTIKADRLQAMKAKDELKKNLLGTLYAAATKDAKAPDDAAVVKTVRSFVKASEETIGLVEARGLDASAQRAERAILEAYLPLLLSEPELRASIAEIVAACPSPRPRPWARSWRRSRRSTGTCSTAAPRADWSRRRWPERDRHRCAEPYAPKRRSLRVTNPQCSEATLLSQRLTAADFAAYCDELATPCMRRALQLPHDKPHNEVTMSEQAMRGGLARRRFVTVLRPL